MKLLLIAAGLLMSNQLRAQEFFRRMQTVEAGIFIHSFGLPFIGDDFFKFSDLPGLSAGATIPINTKGNWHTDYRIRLSGYMAQRLHNGLQLSSEIVKSFQPTPGFRLEGQAGLGYLHTFEDAALFGFHKGSYKRKRDWGQSQITISVGLGFSFRFGHNSPYWFFAEQQFIIQLPFASRSGVPVLMHNRHHLGLRREINQKSREL